MTKTQQLDLSKLQAEAARVQAGSDWEEVLRLTTEALATPELSPETAYDLHKTRAVAYAQLGNHEAVRTEAEQLQRLLDEQNGAARAAQSEGEPAVLGRFAHNDVDLLTILADQAATALESAQRAQRLDKRVEERTADLERRNAELQVINAIQQGLVTQPDFQAIVDLTGDRLREVLQVDNLSIIWSDFKRKVAIPLCAVVDGQRVQQKGWELGSTQSRGDVVNQIVGDGLMATFGAPAPLCNHAEHAVLAAREMVEMIALCRAAGSPHQGSRATDTDRSQYLPSARQPHRYDGVGQVQRQGQARAG